MPFEQKPNTGSLWLTPKKWTRDDGSEYESFSGSCKIGETEYWINGYKKTTAKGEVLDLKFKPKEAPQQNKDLF